ncbi:nitroreductase family deazaflavin-dependent oxidoreductase [Mycolicibacterium canariasense]|nr:nitroreductase family deazaflavin-dependent oxidoreductase [Mycolicibacterium canariasense]
MRIIDRSWPIIGPLARGHAAIYRMTGGRLGERFPGVPPILLLDHVGARSGRLRTTPLVYMRDGDRYVLVAAKGGHPTNPAWFYNLRAHPHATIQIGARRVQVAASEVIGEERQALWPRALAYTSHWRRYAKRVPPSRTIPLVLLQPR